jgi:hypothetical protein
MKIEKRQMVGVALIAASVLVAVFIQACTGHVLEFHIIHTSFVSPTTITTDELIVFHWRYDIPLAAAFIVGLVCCAWPMRKPPRIIGDVAP